MSIYTYRGEPFVPSSNDLLDQIRRAEAKFEKARREHMFERACAINAQTAKEKRAHDCRRHVYVGQSNG